MLRKTLGIEVGPEPLALGPRGVDGAQHLGAVVGPLLILGADIPYPGGLPAGVVLRLLMFTKKWSE